MQLSPFRFSIRLTLLLFLLTPVTSGCDQAALLPPAPATITIAGATSMHPALQELADEFHHEHPNVLFDLRGGGSRLAEEQIKERRIDLAASTLFAPDIDTSTTQTTLQTPKLVRIPIGIDGLAIIVHDSNKLGSLTMQELKELFGGRVFNWEDVGGTGGEVVLISREDGSGARHLFDKRVMDKDPVSLTAVVMPTSQDVVAYAAKTPSAVGYVSRAFVIELLEYGEANPKVDIQSTGSGAAIREPAPIHVLSVDGLLPTDENLEAQTYPLIQPLYLISNGEPQGWVRQFVEFVLSPAGQSIVARHHLPVR